MLTIYYRKTILHYLFKDLSTPAISLMLDKLCKYYDDSINAYRKIWSNSEYINTVILSFLTVQDRIINKEAVFFALFFKYAYADNYLNQDLTVFSTNYYLNFINNFEYGGIQHLKEQVLFLLRNDQYRFNDVGISALDFDYYQDILYYCQPIVHFNLIYTCYHYDEDYKIVNYSLAENSIKDKDELKKGLLNVLVLLKNKTLTFNTSVFTCMHQNKVDKLHIKYKGIL